MANVGRLVKELMVQELSEHLKAHPHFFVVSVGPIQAVEADTLRKRLRVLHARLVVVKRTLGLRGLSALKLNGGAPALFTGSVALVLSGDEGGPVAKIIADFAKAHEGKLVIRGGWVEGQLLTDKRVEELASLPARPQLVAQLIGLLESPIANVVMALEGVLGELAWVLEEAGRHAKPAAEPASAQAE